MPLQIFEYTLSPLLQELEFFPGKYILDQKLDSERLEEEEDKNRIM